MTEKTFKIVNGDLSDGYHTFDELYDHRCLLWINLCVLWPTRGDVYWVREHFEGWDLLVIESSLGQISYHVPVKYRKFYCDRFHWVVPGMQSYDGHTPTDVLKRLEKILT